MPSKYDTNPLDSEYPDKIKAEAEARSATAILEHSGSNTQHFPPTAHTAPTEEQTRRFDQADQLGYQSPYSGQYIPGPYTPGGFVPLYQPIDRKVEKIGLGENIVTAIPYIPWFIGLVAGILLLFFLPQSETKARFHAAQGVAAHLGILVISTFLSVIGNVTGVARAGNLAFQVAATITLLVFAWKAWKGRPVHIAPIEGLTNWLEEKIHPKVIQ